MQLIGQQIDFHESTDGLVIERHQAIPTSYIDGLKAQRIESKQTREGNFMRVCSIPVTVVEKWQREGFDVFHESARAIVARLKLENLDDFLTTNKAV